MSHFIKKCRKCGTVIAQCRCPDPNKTVEYGECDVCVASKKHFVSASCKGEKCAICHELGLGDYPATHKVGEEIMHDDPNPVRHNLTAYVCCLHFWRVFGDAALPCIENLPKPNLTPKRCPKCEGKVVEGEIVDNGLVESTCAVCGHKWKKYIPS